MFTSPGYALRLARASGSRMSLAPRLLVLGCLFAPSLALAAPAPAPSPSPAAPAPTAVSPAPAPATPPVQRPTAGAAATPTTPPPTDPTVAPTSTSAQPAPAPAPPGSAPVVPVAPATGDPAGEDPTAQPSEPAAPAAPGLAEQLLGPSVNQHPSERPAGPVRSEAESAEAEDQAIAAMYRDLYRPKTNPGRFNIVARGVYILAGSLDNTLSGRLGGISADIGQSFNKIGYAVTVAAQFGSLLHTKPDRETQTIALVGGGPTLSLGRLALLQRGFLDVRVGYDFFAGPTRQIVDGAAIADGVRAPHGPRLSLNMGLLGNSARARKLFHGFGLTIGYQALVHSLRGEWPVTNMLQFGLVYWGG
jgi:hypothetical protein